MKYLILILLTGMTYAQDYQPIVQGETTYVYRGDGTILIGDMTSSTNYHTEGFDFSAWPRQTWRVGSMSLSTFTDGVPYDIRIDLHPINDISTRGVGLDELFPVGTSISALGQSGVIAGPYASEGPPVVSYRVSVETWDNRAIWTNLRTNYRNTAGPYHVNVN